MSKPIHLKSLTDPRLAEMIKNGQIGVIPTDTIYGLVGAATSKTAIKKLYSLKTRKRQPGTTIEKYHKPTWQLASQEIQLSSPS